MNVRSLTRAGPAATAVVSAALLLTGCASSKAASGSRTTKPPPPASSTSPSTGLSSRTTSIGTVLTTSSGFTVYELVGATPAHSACTGGCLSVWPPVTVGGHQVDVNGHPAYLFSGDSAPGQVNGQGLQDSWGKWWALSPSGNPITGTSKSATTGGGGAYGY